MEPYVTSLLLLTALACAQDRTDSLCAQQLACGDCVRTPSCHWCATPMGDDIEVPLVRCMHKARIEPGWCPGHLVMPESRYTVLTNKTLGIVDNETVQISPQRARLKLRVGEKFKLQLQYLQAHDYPVDLYYLMDLSNSMADDKDELSLLGDRLANIMKNLTRNFRLGFGSFVDKREMPFVSTVPSKLKSPCIVKVKGKKNTPCASPYSFKNHMPLSEDTEKFSREVERAEVSGNLDSPEGGFDALMQAIVCTEEISWRPNARHIIVFSTDAGFHLAGDGRLAGIVEPNDCRCHLNKNGEYTHDLVYDYPSIAQINQKAQEKSVNIIFAVIDDRVYEPLARNILGASSGKLDKDSANVIDLIRQMYDKLVDTVKLTHNASKAIKVNFESKCLNPNGEMRETSECGGIRVDTLVNFTAVIQVPECPVNKDVWSETLEIKPHGINESLLVELEVICGCNCEINGNAGYELNSRQCKSKGTSICGICRCNDGWAGHHCECAENDLNHGKVEKTDACIANNETNTVCNGRGTCKCGLCDCFKRAVAEETFYGKYCECDNFSCDRHNNMVCSGRTRGHCSCGECQCLPGWGGPACQCQDSNTTCIAPGDDTECSDHGQCVCGQCQCTLTDKFRYSGKYCKDCPNCPGGRCKELGPCVECQAYSTGKLSKEDCLKCSFKVEIVEEILESDKIEHEQFCKLPDDSGCTYLFKYNNTHGDILQVRVQRHKECSGEVDILGLVLGVIGSTVIIGLLIILIWKLLTYLHDRREYAKFEKERANAKWDRGDNPLYVQATSTFSNPTFSGN